MNILTLHQSDRQHWAVLTDEKALAFAAAIVEAVEYRRRESGIANG